jgi:hypothetical protein
MKHTLAELEVGFDILICQRMKNVSQDKDENVRK